MASGRRFRGIEAGGRFEVGGGGSGHAASEGALGKLLRNPVAGPPSRAGNGIYSPGIVGWRGRNSSGAVWESLSGMSGITDDPFGARQAS